MDLRLRSIAAGWRTIQGLGRRLAAVRRAGVSWRAIARGTGIPVTTVRRWAKRFLGKDDR